MRDARDIDVRAFEQIIAQGAGFRADDDAVLFGEPHIPGSREGNGRGQCGGGQLLVFIAGANAAGTIGDLERGNV